jgi:hypothetical protein
MEERRTRMVEIWNASPFPNPPFPKPEMPSLIHPRLSRLSSSRRPQRRSPRANLDQHLEHFPADRAQPCLATAHSTAVKFPTGRREGSKSSAHRGKERKQRSGPSDSWLQLPLSFHAENPAAERRVADAVLTRATRCKHGRRDVSRAAARRFPRRVRCDGRDRCFHRFR